MQAFTHYRLLLLLGLLASPLALRAQCDDAADACETILLPYNSTGQYYRAQLFPGEDARLRLTFYRGMLYRVVPCSGAEDGARLLISVYDKTGKLLYNNESRAGDAFVDLSFGATSDYVLVARYAGQASGCAAVLVGYRSQTAGTDDDDL